MILILETFNIDTNKLDSLITNKTKAILPVHLFGLPADMNRILDLTVKRDIKVIEDAACGFGSE